MVIEVSRTKEPSTQTTLHPRRLVDHLLTHLQCLVVLLVHPGAISGGQASFFGGSARILGMGHWTVSAKRHLASATIKTTLPGRRLIQATRDHLLG